MTHVAFTLQPEEVFLELTERLVAEYVDLIEVAPETLWRADANGDLGPNGFFGAILDIGERHDMGFIAHGVGWSPGTLPSPADAERRNVWLRAIAATHEVFRFHWYTDHLGATSLGDEELVLPLAVPMTERHARLIGDNMAQLQAIVPDVGLENTVAYFTYGNPLDEPAFLASALARERQHVLLDLHNVHTMSQNFGFDPDAWIARLALESVIEIHISGGRDSDPAWLPDDAVLRLDSHDDAVPEEVFALLERVAPRCANLRAVTLERMEGTVTEADVPILADELARVRDVVR